MAVAASPRERDVVYPEDRLAWPQTILMGLQHVMAMFGATVLVPLILGFNPNTVIFFSGVATLIFLAVTGRKVPSYLGSSFSFLGAVLARACFRGFSRLLPILFAVVVGYLVSLVDPACQGAKTACHIGFSGVQSAAWVGLPAFSFPSFGDPVHQFSLFWFIPLILVAENAGHVFAIS